MRDKNDRQPAGMANLLAFFGALTVMGALSVALPKPTFSEVEKRDLATLPALSRESWLDGSFSGGVDAFYADTFPFRDFFVQMGATLEEWRGVRVDDVKIHGGAPSQPAPSQPTTPPPETGSTPATPPPDGSGAGESAPESSSAPSQPDDGAVGEQNGSVFIYKGKAMSLFGAGREMGEWYAGVLNAYAKALPDVQVYNLIIPTAIEFGLPEKYSDVSMPQKPVIDHIYATESDEIEKVDAYSQLAAHSDEYLYFGTDHHWTVTGAYYAYVAFCEEAGFTPRPYDSFEWNTKEDFLGTLYAQTNDQSLREHPDHVDYQTISEPHRAYLYAKDAPYTPIQTTVMADYASGVNKYSVFLHGDQPLMEIQTEHKNGRKIVVVKESFGNAFAPLLISHYETVYVVDQRYFQLNLLDFIDEHGVTDLLFINNIFAANTPVHIQWIQNLMYQQFVPPAVEEPEEERSDDRRRNDDDEDEDDGDRRRRDDDEDVEDEDEDDE